MAMVDVYQESIGNFSACPDSVTLVTFALDLTHATTGDGIATIFSPMPGKTIEKIFALVTAITGTSPTYRMTIETVTAPRTPSATPATASAYVDVTPVGAGWVGGALGANHVVGSTSDMLAVTVRYQSGTCDGSNFATFARCYPAAVNKNAPYQLTMTAGTWGGVDDEVSLLVVTYTDGTVQPLMLHGSSTAPVVNNAWNSGSSPIYRGNSFTPGVARQINGVDIAFRVSNDGHDGRVRVLDAAGTVISQSATMEGDKLFGVNTSQQHVRIELEPFTHPAGTKYYYVWEPLTATSNGLFHHVVCESEAAQRAIGGLLKGATGTAVPAWTDYDNGTDGYRVYSIHPVASQIDGGSGGGGPLIGPGRLVRS